MHTLSVVLLLAVCSVSICYAKHKLHKHHHSHPESIHCFSKEDLENSPSEVVNRFVSSKMHWEKYSAVNLVSQVESRRRRKRDSVDSCPDFLSLGSGQAMNQRSISPWVYRIDTDENRFPQKLAFAHCLCPYCISSETGKQNSALNSLPVKQTMLVLRKKTCPYSSSLSTFTLEYISVPVACTCTVPRYS